MKTAVIRSDWAGRTIDGKFPLLACLDDSGPSVLFRTELPGPPAKPAVIRLIPADSEGSSAVLQAWTKAASLSHPHLMRIFAKGQTEIDGTRLLYIVTEFAEERLSEIIPERPLTSDETREMLKPILAGLAYLHDKGIVFRHLKPSNVMVVENQLKLPVDNLGAPSRAAAEQGELSIYDAPEAATGAISPASDVWSLGVTLVETLTQHPPRWDRSNSSDPIVPPSVPQPFADIARRCLRRSPGERATLDGITRRLEGLSEKVETAPAPVAPVAPRAAPAATATQAAAPHAEPAASRPATALASPRPTPPSKRRLRWLLGAGVLLVAVVVWIVVRSNRSEPAPPATVQTPATTAQAPAPPAPEAVPQPRAPQPVKPQGPGARGEVAERVQPEVSAAAMRTIRGKVQVRIAVSAGPDGTVSGASIQSSGGSRYFADHALQAARRWRFRPAQVNGQPAPSRWTVQFVFRQGGITDSAVQVSP